MFIFLTCLYLGSSLNSYYNDINVYDISTNSWLQSFSSSDESYSSGLSGGIIAGVTIACIVLLVIILFLLWKFQSYVRWFFNRLHRDIWKPRYVLLFLFFLLDHLINFIFSTGEPVWAETTRIIFQVILLFIFSVFLAFVLRQAIDSPNITQTIQEAAASVQVPGTV